MSKGTKKQTASFHQVDTDANVIVIWMKIALGGATGICYLHHECSPPVIHSNILFDEDCEAKIVTHGYIAPGMF